jgi:GNAT superfamily N-acetyltransferase
VITWAALRRLRLPPRVGFDSRWRSVDAGLVGHQWQWGRYSHGVVWPVTDAPVVLLRLSAADAGEVFTLQRAAYVTEAQAHGDLALPPLVQSLAELVVELTDPQVLALGLREGARLVAAVRVRIEAEAAELRRLVVAPDRQGYGLGSRLLREAEKQVPSVSSYCGCSRVNIASRISACTNGTATSEIIGVPAAITSSYT